jgi:parallel beta-helix repeat protein
VVSFRKGTGLVIVGVLIARGTPEASIRFASAETAPERGDWSGIQLRGDGESTILERCRIVHAATAILVPAGAPAIRECEITTGGMGMRIERNGSPVLTGNRITEMTEGGISCQLGASPTIERNVLRGCGPAGIFASNNAAPVVRGNTVEECGRGLAINGTIPPVEGNVFRKNGAGIVAIQCGKDQVVRGNRFEGNDVGLRCENFSTPLAEGNVFTGNGDAISCVQASSPLIRRNEISGNRRGIACEKISNPRIAGNEIRANGKGIYLTLSSYAVVNGNNIHGNGIQMEVENMSSDWERRAGGKLERGATAQLANRIGRGMASPGEWAQGSGDRAVIMDAVDATGNWWGEPDTEEMERKGPQANIAKLIDGHDVPVRTYEGYPGEYKQDKIRYDGWKRNRIPDAGLPAKGKEPNG